MKNYNLLLAKRKILNIFITYEVFWVKKSIEEVKFVFQRARDLIRRHLLAGKY